MGEKGTVFIKTEENPAVSIESYCMTFVNIFKLLGLPGNSFISHSKRVSEISYRLSKASGLRDEDILCVKMAGLVHDIGHMAIDKHILLKSGVLTTQEYELVKLHPLKGEELLNSIKELKEIADIVSQHHERIDGLGYPRGLKEKSIKKAARIISIAEAYDSMVSEYSYKKPVSKDVAISELLGKRGSQFDGEIVELFIHSLPEIIAL